MENIISIDNLTFAYKRSKNVLQEIYAQINEGDLITLLGPNGVGKSTLLNCITGLLYVKRNVVKINNCDIASLKIRHIAQNIAYVPQKFYNGFDYTVREYVTMGRIAHKNLFELPNEKDYSTADKALEELKISHLKEYLFSKISSGEQQQVCIARAIAQEPKLIVLDEPTSSLDYDNQIKVLNLVKKLSEFGYAVLMTTHNPDHSLLLNSTVWILNRCGHMVVGTAENLITEEILNDLYDSEICISKIPFVNRKICFVNRM